MAVVSRIGTVQIASGAVLVGGFGFAPFERQHHRVFGTPVWTPGDFGKSPQAAVEKAVLGENISSCLKVATWVQ